MINTPQHNSPMGQFVRIYDRETDMFLYFYCATSGMGSSDIKAPATDLPSCNKKLKVDMASTYE
jgi:hypothetical protein